MMTASKIADHLSRAIDEKGAASLIVSGGSSPSKLGSPGGRPKDEHRVAALAPMVSLLATTNPSGISASQKG